jgi:hypothetical protein
VVGRNVTVAPDAQATPVEAPAITQVLSLRTGRLFDAQDLIGRQRYDRLIGGFRDVLSDAIRMGRPRLVCSVCQVPVRLVASPQKRFFFRHLIEDGSCPAVTKSASESEIRAMKYNGQRESVAHQETKAWIADSLSADASFSAIDVERTWNSRQGFQRRRPDVQAVRDGLRLAFEAQLSTTFLDVVRDRRAFYLQEGALLVWVLRHFTPDNRRLTEDDILFTNNSNVLVVDAETVYLSKQSGRFQIRCHYREPFIEKGRRREQWRQRIVPFDALTLDQARQRVFLFDFEEEEWRVSEQLKQAAAQRDDDLRREILGYWLSGHIRRGFVDEDQAAWRETVARAAAQGVILPELIETPFRAAVSALLSAKVGEPVGSGFKKLVEVANLVANQYPALAMPFGWALREYDTLRILEEGDRKGTWKKKSRELRRLIAANPTSYKAPLPYSPALRFLFPEIATRLP